MSCIVSQAQCWSLSTFRASQDPYHVVVSCVGLITVKSLELSDLLQGCFEYMGLLGSEPGHCESTEALQAFCEYYHIGVLVIFSTTQEIKR